MSSPAVSKAASSGGTLPNALALALLLPLILLLAGAFVTPILVLIFESLFAPDLTFEHYVDRATPNLIQYCLTGKHIGSAVLVMRIW